MLGKWKYTVDISHWWKGKPTENGGLEEWSDYNVHELGKYVADKLKTQFPKQVSPDSEVFDPDLDDVVYYLSTVDEYNAWRTAILNLPQGSDMRFIEEEYPPLDQFNSAMGCLYDWADKNMVWIKTLF